MLEAREKFDEMDINKDGKITREEVTECILSAAMPMVIEGFKVAKEAVRGACQMGFETADVDGSGDLNPEEWVTAKEMLASMADENEDFSEKMRNIPFE